MALSVCGLTAAPCPYWYGHRQSCPGVTQAVLYVPRFIQSTRRWPRLVVVVVVHACLCRYTLVDAPNWGGRTPGSQTPGVNDTLGLNVQKDGGRKMLQTCSKLPLIAATRVPATVAKKNVHKLRRRTESEALDCRNPTSLQDHRDVHSREGTAAAALPRSVAESEPCAPVVQHWAWKTTCIKGASTTSQHAADEETLWSSEQAGPWGAVSAA